MADDTKTPTENQLDFDDRPPFSSYEKYASGTVISFPISQKKGKRRFDKEERNDLKAALAELGLTVRLNDRAKRMEFRQAPFGEFLPKDDPKHEWLREELLKHFDSTCDTKATKEKPSEPVPYRFGSLELERELLSLAAEHRVDPFGIWLKELPAWDGTKRVKGLIHSLFDARDNPAALVHWAARYCFLGPIARTYEPGRRQDEAPVLVGPRACGKSLFLESLLPPEKLTTWMNPGFSFNNDPKVMLEGILGFVIVIISEMAGATTIKQERIKSYMSLPQDSGIRLCRRNDPEDAPRRCAFFGTANPGDVLPNEANNRNFVCVNVEEKDIATLIEYMNDNREQLWAEGMAMYHDGIEARLPYALRKLQSEANETHRAGSPEMENDILDWLAKQDFQVLRDGFAVEKATLAAKAKTERERRAVYKCLRDKFGYEKGRSTGGRHVWKLRDRSITEHPHKGADNPKPNAFKATVADDDDDGDIPF